MGRVFVLALTAALNPSLLAAVTLMLALEKPKRLLLGYLAGAMLTSVTCGLLLVFELPDSSASSIAKQTVNPILNVALGVLVLLVLFVVVTGRDRRRRAWSERRHAAAKDKPPPRWRRQLSKGAARDTFVVGVLLSFPGASFIAGMDALNKQHLTTLPTVLAVLGFSVVMLALLEIPLLGYVIKPEATEAVVKRCSSWLAQHGSRSLEVAVAVLAILLIVRGFVNW